MQAGEIPGDAGGPSEARACAALATAASPSERGGFPEMRPAMPPQASAGSSEPQTVGAPGCVPRLWTDEPLNLEAAEDPLLLLAVLLLFGCSLLRGRH